MRQLAMALLLLLNAGTQNIARAEAYFDPAQTLFVSQLPAKVNSNNESNCVAQLLENFISELGRAKLTDAPYSKVSVSAVMPEGGHAYEFELQLRNKEGAHHFEGTAYFIKTVYNPRIGRDWRKDTNSISCAFAVNKQTFRAPFILVSAFSEDSKDAVGNPRPFLWAQLSDN